MNETKKRKKIVIAHGDTVKRSTHGSGRDVICKGMKKYGITGRRSHIKARVVDYLFKNGPSTSDTLACYLSDTTRWGGSTVSLSLILRRDSIFAQADKVKVRATHGGTYWTNVWKVNKDKLYEKHGYKES